MAKGTAFLLIGHGDWGKSQTLKALTGGTHQQRWISITGKSGVTHKWFIRRSANSDDLDSFLEFIKKNAYEYLIIAFSSNIGAADILKYLASHYTLRCFVLEHRYECPEETIPPDELAIIQQYAATVSVYEKVKSEAEIRAVAFRSFIEDET